MKRFAFVLLTFALLGALTACGLGDSPKKAAQEWIQAFANLDGNKIAERTCAAQQANVQQAGMWASVFGLFGQQTIGQQAKTDVSGLKFTTVSSSGNTANVRVTGQIRVAVMALSQTQDVDETWRMVQEGGKWKWCGQAGTSIAPPPQTRESPTQVVPVTPATQKLVDVQANVEWQDTGIAIRVGDTITIRYVSGQWSIWPPSLGGVDPFTDGEGQLGRLGGKDAYIPEKNIGSLIGRIGLYPPFYVGDGTTIRSNYAGNLILSMNDVRGQFRDNGGSLIIAVVIEP